MTTGLVAAFPPVPMAPLGSQLAGGRPLPWLQLETTSYCVGVEEFVAHGSTVKCLAIGRKSGRVMVTGGEDNKVNLWAIGKANCIMSLTGHTTAVECVKFCPAEEMVCAGSTSGTVKIWNLEAAKMVRTLAGHKGNVRCMDFHPHAEFLASGSMDTTIKLWDTRKKGCIYTYKGHNKCVNSLKFSPDGRWIASGSEDGSVKLWDLPAGKMLSEFRDHCGPVNDVDFHPNEFLLASGSSDSTVKFWDLENFNLVSSTEGDSGVVRCVFFNPDGACLFSGAEDFLKVYCWEPVKTCDTLVMGWNRVADISIAQNQLIAGAFSLTNVAVYVIDLNRVQPFGGMPNNSTMPQYITPSPFKAGSHIRRSFSKDKKDAADYQVMRMKPLDDGDTFPLETEGEADIKDFRDYNKIFHPSQESSLETLVENINSYKPALEPQSSKVVRLSGASNPCVLTERPGASVKETRQLSVTTSYSAMGTTFTIRPRGSLIGSGALLAPDPPTPSIMAAIPGYSSVGVVPTNIPVPASVLPSKVTSRAMPTGPISAIATSLGKPIEKATAMVRTSSSQVVESSSTVSIVRPVMSVLPDSKEALAPPQKAVVHPEQKQSVDYVPSQRDTPAGLDLDEFLPRHLQASLRLGSAGIPEMSEAEALSTIAEQHKTLLAVLHHRLKNIKIVLAQWSTKDPKMALDTAINMNDQSTLVDILNVVVLRPQIWTLDMCQTILPAIFDLLQSKYESYMSTGCACLRILLKNFASVIKTNITAPPGVGVDISREERYNKCMSCYNQLLSIRSFLLKRQTMQGKLGHLFREMHILMQGLE
ncbi:katanin p80 WD40 repeat-containing subunit B1 isoform X3 [Dermacentor andersoni]|uniref:katanin p80 WD40 repeat-containing subunit B1 isoform X3 n=1 Tax=Dermacentor andersoni TaxID=34620 RepID=UPI002417855C|nr:katanin p80 WD40 repeat-containing subunit B1-like isoform X3 [Dermacentor andersoni]